MWCFEESCVLLYNYIREYTNAPPENIFILIWTRANGIFYSYEHLLLFTKLLCESLSLLTWYFKEFFLRWKTKQRRNYRRNETFVSFFFLETRIINEFSYVFLGVPSFEFCFVFLESFSFRDVRIKNRNIFEIKSLSFEKMGDEYLCVTAKR